VSGWARGGGQVDAPAADGPQDVPRRHGVPAGPDDQGAVGAAVHPGERGEGPGAQAGGAAGRVGEVEREHVTGEAVPAGERQELARLAPGHLEPLGRPRAEEQGQRRAARQAQRRAGVVLQGGPHHVPRRGDRDGVLVDVRQAARRGGRDGAISWVRLPDRLHATAPLARATDRP
jgi:hypothetical protein